MVVSDRTKGCCSNHLNEPPHPNHDQFAELDAHNSGARLGIAYSPPRPFELLAKNREAGHEVRKPLLEAKHYRWAIVDLIGPTLRNTENRACEWPLRSTVGAEGGPRLVQTRSIRSPSASKNGPDRPGATAALSPSTTCSAGRSRAGLRRASTSPRLEQFSGHASLKSLEEYLELDRLQQHPLKDVL